MIVAIIQARMGSSRLPGKVLADIAGTPMLKRIIERIQACQMIERVVVATTVSPSDQIMEDWVRANTSCGVYRGSEDDVLDRFFRCAKECNATIVVRVTADDPLKDPGIISEALSALLEDPSLDYCSNTLTPTYPEGLDIEVFRMGALERAHREADLASDREHVTPYIWRHPDLFKLKNLAFERDLSAWRWTVDKPADMEFVRAIFDRFKETPLVSFRDVIEFIEQRPELMAINSGTVRNEGYLKSINLEK